MIPVVALQRQEEGIRAEIDAAFARVRERGQFILGPEVEAFEKAFAQYCEAKHAVGVASGTEALQIALLACGIGPGDEVITVAHTAAATVAAVELAGARPVLTDIDPVRQTLDPARIEPALTQRTRAILPVHLYGQPADLSPMLDIAARRNLALIEDCAQAAGARYRGRRVGAWGNAAAFSFYPTKNLGAYGDGGAVVTDDDGLAERARAIRQYGWNADRICRGKGINSRLDEIQAALLSVKLARLEDWNAERRRLAGVYRKGLASAGLRLPPEPPDSAPVYYTFTVRHPRRDSLRAHLARHGVGTAIHYPCPVHLQPGFRNLNLSPGDLPETERAAQEVLSLPMFPGLREDEIRTVIDAVNGF
ncbi:MAG: DegT/DnrJ/EryC1/StrS family aminotransferase [Anaerolineales bacterium]|nr:DegT/DnrJ/EryC1/StrS family aminotransferase [Anaerolineales bacterium]